MSLLLPYPKGIGVSATIENMKFNSKSVILNRGINLKVNLKLPLALTSYPISSEIWEKSLYEFNKQMDKRNQVSEIIEGVKVDILRLKRGTRGVFIWMFANENDISIIEKLRFTFKGKLVFENKDSNTIEKILINDLLYGFPTTEKSIFKK